MSVTFLNVLFQNNTGLDIELTIEAPISMVVFGPQPVQGNAKVDIPINRHNCLSARLIAEYPDHGATQEVVLGPPSMGNGRPIYLQGIEARFTAADIAVNVKARTENF